MKIKKLTVKNFRNFEKTTLKSDNNICVLIGNNGTGKSSMLEAISSVFAYIFDNKMVPEFKFVINYEINNTNVIINYLTNNPKIIIDGSKVNKLPEELKPSKVICLYSGEELRLWENFYETFYNNYISRIRRQQAASIEMLMLDSDFWEIAVISLYLFDLNSFHDIRDFLKRILGDISIKSISLNFDITKMKKWSSNRILAFIDSINPKHDPQITISLEDLRNHVLQFGDISEFYQLIFPAYLSDNNSIISTIEATLSNDINIKYLSEGEKRLLLVKFVLEIVSDEKSLLLMDEPDSHIHISRKSELKDTISNYIGSRNSILTTHSPTLTHCFEDDKIRLLTKANNGKTIIDQNGSKRKAINEITNSFWSYNDAAIFLSTDKDILLVEGKTDVAYINTALNKLQSNGLFSDLKFEIFPFGGSTNLKEIIDKFEPKNDSQTIVALLDRDKAGAEAIKDITGQSVNKQEYDYEKFHKIYLSLLPIKKYYRGTKECFLIEDYFKTTKIKNLVYPKEYKSFATIANKENIKKALANSCKDFDVSEFNGFKALFEKLTQIKNS